MKDHHFGQIRAYLVQLINQAVAELHSQHPGNQSQRAALERDRLCTPPQVAGLQLTDVLANAFFQSIKRACPHYGHKRTHYLRPLMAEGAARPKVQASRANKGVPFYPATMMWQAARHGSRPRCSR